MIHWIAHHLGLDNGSGRWYLWWSGAGSDVTELLVIGGIWRALNCHELGCWRVGTKMTTESNGHHYRRCSKHHKVRHGSVA